jgi:hypothetical protein
MLDKTFAIFPTKFKKKQTLYTSAQIDDIRRDLIANEKLPILREKWGMTYSMVKYFIQKYMHSDDQGLSSVYFKEQSSWDKPLGHKTVPYFANEEQIEKDLTFVSELTWDSLTQHEKIFYYDYLKKRISQKNKERFSSNTPFG